MYDPRGDRAWRRRRALMISEARASMRPYLCWRCEQPIDFARDAVELGHVIDWALMREGETARLRLEHRACNREAGLALALDRRARPRTTNQAWTSRELR